MSPRIEWDCWGLPSARPQRLAGCGRSMSSDPLPRIKLAEALRSSTGGKSEGPAVAKSTSTGWATLKGRFVFNGTPPVLGRLDATKDQQVCGTSLPNQSLEVDGSTKGIANVLVFARSKLGRVFDESKKAAGPTLFDQKQLPVPKPRGSGQNQDRTVDQEQRPDRSQHEL